MLLALIPSRAVLAVRSIKPVDRSLEVLRDEGTQKTKDRLTELARKLLWIPGEVGSRDGGSCATGIRR